MKYIYRGEVVFEYVDGAVIQRTDFNNFRWTADCCKTLSTFFFLVNKHKLDNSTLLRDINA